MANGTTLESYFELLCTSLSLVRPAGKIPPSVNYTILCAGIMTLNHNVYKIMNVIGYGTTMTKMSVELSWSFSWKLCRTGQYLRSWHSFSITGQRL